jgi:capsular exopolysaccharide synthesis family protein
MLPILPFQPDQRQIDAGPYPPPLPENSTFGAFTAVLRRHRLLVALCVLLAVVLGEAYTLLASRVYEATSVLRFELEQVNLPQLVQQLSTENRINTEIEVLRGRSAAAAVIDSLGLRARLVAPRRGRASDFFSVLRVAPATDTLTLIVRAKGGSFEAKRADPTLDEVSGTVGDTLQTSGVSLAVTPAALQVAELRLKVVSLDEAVRSFESGLTVSRPARDADLIAARVRSSDPVLAAATANLLAQQLISGRQGVQMARTGSTVRFLKQQLDTLGIQLRAAEDALRGYRERLGVVDAEEEARTQVKRLAQVQADRGAVEAERQALALLVEQMRSDSAQALPGGQAKSRGLISFPTLFRNQAASELLGALAQVENERSSLLVRRKPEDPDVQVLTARIRELDAQLQGIAETYLQGLTNQVSALEEVARGFGGALNRLPKKEVQTARLEREVKVQQELYTLIQTRLKEAEITQAMEDPSVRIVDAAVVPERPVRPKPLLNLALSLLLGSLLGVGAALGRELSNRSVRTRADALLGSGLPILGAIPRVDARSVKLLPRPSRRRRHTHQQRHKGLHRAARRLRRALTGAGRSEGYGAASRIESLLVTRSETPVAYVESFNQLHANLILAHQERQPKIVVFTSPLPGEGKTLSSINFALTLAGRGLRVLLIDADLRCGLVHEVFGSDRQPGFAELLSGSARFEDGARRILVGENAALVILPAGAPVQNPGRQLGIERVREVLEALAPRFDLIIIDSPPVNILADAALLGSAADAVVLVVRAGHTRIEALRYATDQLTAARAPVIGTLLNDIDLRRHSDDDGSYHYLTEVERYYAGRS